MRKFWVLADVSISPIALQHAVAVHVRANTIVRSNDLEAVADHVAGNAGRLNSAGN